MSKDEILQRVLFQFYQVTDIELDPKKPIVNYELDSVDYMKIMIGIENEFDFEFCNEDLDLEKYGTIESFVSFLAEHYLTGYEQI